MKKKVILIKNGRLSSFTLVEVLAVIAISSIVVSLTVATFINFNKEYSLLSHANNKAASIFSLFVWLNNDLDEAFEIKAPESNKLLIRKRDNYVNYFIKEDMVVRKDTLSADTIKVSVQDFSLGFLENSEWVQTVSFTIKFQTHDYDYIYFKEYYPGNILSNEKYGI